VQVANPVNPLTRVIIAIQIDEPNQAFGPAGIGCCLPHFVCALGSMSVLGGCLFEAFQGRQPPDGFSSLLLRDA
jgi:hypothetical protein